jgi:uncharacterized protein (TIGR02001 family)
MNKVVLSVAAALAVCAAVPAYAADMPVKAKVVAPAPAPSPFDIAFGTALTTDYILRGISQSDRRPAVQGYFEGDLTASSNVTLYAGMWGSSLFNGFGANMELDISGGARLTLDKFGLDVGYVYYDYVDSNPNLSYGEIYAKPTYTVNDWLKVGGSVYWGNNWGNTGNSATYFTGNVAVTVPVSLPAGITTTVSAEIGRQLFGGTIAIDDYTTWNAGVAFGYKAMTLDLRYYDTDLDSSAPQNAALCAFSANGRTTCGSTFVATLKFDTTLSALK